MLVIHSIQWHQVNHVLSSMLTDEVATAVSDLGAQVTAATDHDGNNKHGSIQWLLKHGQKLEWCGGETTGHLPNPLCFRVILWKWLQLLLDRRAAISAWSRQLKKQILIFHSSGGSEVQNQSADRFGIRFLFCRWLLSYCSRTWC